MQPTLFGGTTQRLDGLDRIEGLLCRSLTALFQPHSTASLSRILAVRYQPRCTAIPVRQKDTACHVPTQHPTPQHLPHPTGRGRVSVACGAYLGGVSNVDIDGNNTL